MTAAVDPSTASTLLIASPAPGVLHITFNRPDARNAMSMAMVDELLAALARAEADGTTRVVVLRGAGGHFCAGGDVKDIATAVRTDRGCAHAAIMQINRRFGDLCAAYAASPLAIVAVTEGAVMGGGFGLACAVDVTLADASAKFRLSETSLGLVPAQIAPYLVERLGIGQARRLAVTGGTLDAEAAAAVGLAHECLPDTAALDAALARTVADILACAPGALAATKALMRRARLAAPADLIDDAATLFADAVLSDEGVEGTLAFMQKRKPRWHPGASS